MFFNAREFNQNLTSWGSFLTNITVANGLFSGCRKYDQPLTGWNSVFSNVSNCSKIFQNCFVFNQDVSFLDFSSATTWQEMFAQARLFNQPLTAWSSFAANIQSFRLMFFDAESFNRNLASWDISSLNDAFGMFNDATSLSTSNLDNLLIGWAAQIPSIQNNVDFDARNTARSAASNAAVNALTSAPYNWNVNTL